VREIVIVISDLYLAPGQTRDPTDAGGGAGAIGTLPGFEHAVRFGRRRTIEGEGGWRPWLARWLGRDDLAGLPPAVIAGAAVGAKAGASAAPGDTGAKPAPATLAAPGDTGAEPAPATLAAPGDTGAKLAPATLAAPGDTGAKPVRATLAAPGETGAKPAPAAAAAPVTSGANATAAALADGAPAEPHDSAWIATPVHLIAGLTSLHLDRRSILRLSQTELDGFAQDFNQTFGDTALGLVPLANGDFLLRGPTTLIATTTEPSRALVADLEASLPKGTNAKALKRLGAELEMWLHAHPLNEVRRRRGELPVSALWLWGGGAQPLTQPNSPTASSSMPSDVALGSDPYLLGLWHAQGRRTHALPDDKLASLLTDTHAQRAVLVTEVTPMLHSNPRWAVFEALAELDRLYVSPAIAALRSGAIERVVLIVNDTELRVGRRDRLKLWRRPRSAIEGLQA
jgi:hypothetical protein